MTTPAIPEGFTPWNGGANPIPGKRARILHRSGISFDVSGDEPPIIWKHLMSAPFSDIIAYRVVGDTE